MIYESDLYSIEYDKKSEKLVQTINEALSQNFQRVIDFWGIEKLDNHVKIKVYSELDDWIKFYENISGTQYQDYVVGCANGSDIYVLAHDEYKKTQMHKTDYPKETLFSNDFFSISNDLYSVSQKIVRKLVEKVSHDKLIEYAVDYTKLYKDWDDLKMGE